MKKAYILILFVAIVLASCGGAAKPGNNLDEKKAKLVELEGKMKDIGAEIKTLREEVMKLDTNAAVFTGRYVTAAGIQPQAFVHKIEIQGTADSDENVIVTTDFGGTVEKVHVTEGQKVAKGQVLLSLDDDIVSKQIEEIKVSLDLASTTYEKQQRLWDQKIGSELQFLQAKNQKESMESRLASARAQLDKAQVVSPINGIVDKLNINQGEMATPGKPLLRVVDLSKIEIHADASENYLKAIQLGDSVTVYFPALGVTKDAKIKYLGNVIDPTNRTFGVKIDIDNQNGKLKANLLAVIEITDYEKDSALVVPTKYIQQVANKDAVFVVSKEDGKTIARRVEVKVGKTYNGQSEILEGIKAGDLVIAEGSRDLANGEEIIVKQD